MRATALCEDLRTAFAHYATVLLIVVSGVAAGCGKSTRSTEPPREFESSLQSLAAARPAIRPLIDQALAAFQSGDYVGTVTLLQSTTRQSQLNPEQYMVVQGAIKTVTRQLTARALKGDEKAKADFSAIDRVLSQ